MNTTKMTNAKALDYVLKNCSVPDDVKEKLENMKASLAKKASNTTRKPTERQKENVKLQSAVLAYLRANPDTAFTCTELMKGVPELAATPDIGNQRVAALLRALKENGYVVKETVKGKSVFSAAEGPLELELDPSEVVEG